MNRVVYLVLASSGLLCLWGCNSRPIPSAHVDTAPTVSFEQLKEFTKDEPAFWSLGVDEHYAYFRIKSGFVRISIRDRHLEGHLRYKKVARDRGMPVDHGATRYVIREDHFAVPDKGYENEPSYPFQQPSITGY